MSRVAMISINQQQSPNRPLAITIICIVGFIGAILSVPMALSPVASQIGNWFPPYSGLVTVISFISMIGLWFTQKWAVYSYLGLVLCNQVVLLLMDQWYPIVLIVHSIIVAITMWHFEPHTARAMVNYMRRQIWTILVAYMVGIHNFYKGEQKTADDITIVIEDVEVQEDSAPKQ